MAGLTEPAMNTLHIDFISDVSCPWCAIGLNGLLQAIQQLQREAPGSFQLTLNFLPFELNPDMPPGGQDITEHLTQKYGSTPEQQAQIRATIAQRGAEVGFAFATEGRGRIYNTFHAHRLLHWAGLQGMAEQLTLKQALLTACHTQRQAMDDRDVLLRCVQEAGLDTAEAQALLDDGRHAEDVREAEAMVAEAGIRAVPAVVVNRKHLISGGQPVANYVEALRGIAARG
jgi:predicted DsbA family dithiol-disulfide isomerase